MVIQPDLYATYLWTLAMWTFTFLELLRFFFVKNWIKKVDLQFALCNKVNSNQALFLPLMIKLSNKKSQIKSGSRKELSKFLASKHKYPSLLCKWSKNTHHKIKAVFFSQRFIFWAKDYGAIVCGAKEIQKKIFGAIVFGQISLGQMSLNQWFVQVH